MLSCALHPNTDACLLLSLFSMFLVCFPKGRKGATGVAGSYGSPGKRVSVSFYCILFLVTRRTYVLELACSVCIGKILVELLFLEVSSRRRGP